VKTLTAAFTRARSLTAGLSGESDPEHPDVEIRLETSDRLGAPPAQAFAPDVQRWRIVAPRLATPTVAGALSLNVSGACVTLEGFFLDGHLRLGAELDCVHLRHVTMNPAAGRQLRVAAGAWGLCLRAERSILGAIRADLGAAPLVLEDCVVDGRGAPLSACGETTAGAAKDAIEATGAFRPALEANGVTFAGPVRLEAVDAVDCLFLDGVEVLQGQEGCLRHSYLGPDLSAPPRHPVSYRCGPFPAPTFASIGFEAGGYYALALEPPTRFSRRQATAARSAPTTTPAGRPASRRCDGGSASSSRSASVPTWRWPPGRNDDRRLHEGPAPADRSLDRRAHAAGARPARARVEPQPRRRRQDGARRCRGRDRTRGGGGRLAGLRGRRHRERHARAERPRRPDLGRRPDGLRAERPRLLDAGPDRAAPGERTGAGLPRRLRAARAARRGDGRPRRPGAGRGRQRGADPDRLPRPRGPTVADTCQAAWDGFMRVAGSTGLLSVERVAPAAPADPCAPPGDPLGQLPDGLFRVEVIDPGGPGDARFAWSFENGGAAVAVSELAGDRVTLRPSAAVKFASGEQVEVSWLARREDRVPHGALYTISQPPETGRGGDILTLDRPPTAPAGANGLVVRRWDGEAVGAAAAVSAALRGTDLGVRFRAGAGA
jgi:hypothetical protein